MSSTVGEVRLEKNGSYVGRVKTLSINIPIEIVPVAKKTTPKGPDFMILSRTVEVGAAWTRKGERSGKDYVSCAFTAREFGGRFFANTGRKPGTKAEEKIFSLILNDDRAA